MSLRCFTFSSRASISLYQRNIPTIGLGFLLGPVVSQMVDTLSFYMLVVQFKIFCNDFSSESDHFSWSDSGIPAKIKLLPLNWFFKQSTVPFMLLRLLLPILMLLFSSLHWADKMSESDFNSSTSLWAYCRLDLRSYNSFTTPSSLLLEEP